MSSCGEEVSDDDCGWQCFEAFGKDFSLVGFENGSNCCRCLFRSDRLSDPLDISPFGQIMPASPAGASGRPTGHDNDQRSVCFLFYGPKTEAPSKVPSLAPTASSIPSSSPSVSMAPSISFASLFTFTGQGFCQDGVNGNYYGAVYNSCDSVFITTLDECGRFSYHVYGNEPSYLGFSWNSETSCCYVWFDANRSEDPSIIFPFVGDILSDFDGNGPIVTADGTENWVCYAANPDTEAPSKVPSTVPTATSIPTISQAPSTAFDSLYNFVGPGWCQDGFGGYYGSIFTCSSTSATDAIECGLVSHEIYGGETSFLGFNWDGTCCYATFDANREQDPPILSPFNDNDLALYNGNGLISTSNGAEALLCYTAKSAGATAP